MTSTRSRALLEKSRVSSPTCPGWSLLRIVPVTFTRPSRTRARSPDYVPYPRVEYLPFVFPPFPSLLIIMSVLAPLLSAQTSTELGMSLLDIVVESPFKRHTFVIFVTTNALVLLSLLVAAMVTWSPVLTPMQSGRVGGYPGGLPERPLVLLQEGRVGVLDYHGLGGLVADHDSRLSRSRAS